jgi:glucose/arabinose dehydrogenase
MKTTRFLYWFRQVRFPALAAALVMLLSMGTGTAEATNLPTGFTETTILSSFPQATSMVMAPDGRFFIAEQTGALRVVQNGVLLPTPFLTVSVSPGSERGLLGVTLDPNFPTEPYVYIYYTMATTPARNRISRFTANGNVAVAGSEFVLMDLEDLTSATNHNGGTMHFGPDGKLYVGVGENAVPANSQVLTNRLGKILRINRDGTIPTDNPFYTTAAGVNRSIWALGLRNPFSIAFQPGTGRLFINDVGAGSWEEINDGIAGANYGWPTTEGPTTNPAFVSPLFAYPHTGQPFTGCAITGGAFYNPATQQFPAAYTGIYFFADFCQQWIKAFNPGTGQVTDFITNARSGIVDIDIAPNGDLYYLARGFGGSQGGLFRVSYTLTPPVTPTGLTTLGNLNTAPASPVYRWDHHPATLGYYLFATGPQGQVYGNFHSAAAICTTTTCQVTQTPAIGSGSYVWRVIGWNSNGYGQYSAPASFTVSALPPTPTGLVTGGNLTTVPAQPIYQWSRSANTQGYYVYAGSASGAVYGNFHSASSICNATTCQVTQSPALGAGSYSWKVIGWNPSGYGSYSVTVPFTIGGLPQTPTGLTVLGNLTTAPATPTFQWNHHANTLGYYLYAQGASGQVVGNFYGAGTICTAAICQATPSVSLPAGSYVWKVIGWNQAGYGSYSQNATFVVGGGAAIVTPTSTPTSTPEPSATAEPSATPTAEATITPLPTETATFTPEPTAEPTQEPTAEPTIVPTNTPEPTPSGSPSDSG